ncbi:MAG: DEAD/DEAH box helicase [Thermomicrobiales bacterium]
MGLARTSPRADDDLRTDRRIARDLPTAWPAFFARFGRLTAVQRAAIPTILDGGSVLVLAATASGKTEAAGAPLVERFSARRSPWTILYLSPTRALVNDLYARLLTPLDALHLRVERRTGDHRAELTTLPHVLLTTPESLDSILCRHRRPGGGHALDSVVAVVLDEIHLLHGTARGEQVRWLLERLLQLLARAGASPPQVVALSATVPDPEAVRAAFLPGGAIVAVAGGREIEAVTPASASTRVEDALLAYLAGRRDKEKILVFCNTRRRVDTLTAALRAPLAARGYTVWAHHGSLDQRMRERAEAEAKEGTGLVIVATSTLEIGIDIGDIDLVALDGPPPDLPALLQRIGRGNRRTGATRVLACAETPVEALVQSAMIEAARDGWLGPAHRGPQHAVARQQLASLIFAGAKITTPRAVLQDVLDRCAAPVVAQSLLPALIECGELSEDRRGVGLGQDWRDRAARGSIHSNIESTGGKVVVDEESGAVIARGVTAHGGHGMRAGGHLLEIQRWDAFRIEVRRVSDPARGDGDWRYATGRMGVRGPGQPAAVRRYLGIPEEIWPVVHLPSATYAFHFGGARRQAVLELTTPPETQRGDVISTPWYIQVVGTFAKPAWLAQATGSRVASAVDARLDELERLLGRPTVNRALPRAIRLDEVYGWLGLDDECDHLRRAIWQPVTDTDILAVLHALIAQGTARGNERSIQKAMQ